MISITLIDNVRKVSFSCSTCIGRRYPCISCQQERSVYDMAFTDGKNDIPPIKEGLNSNHSNIFDIGYKHGQESNNDFLYL